jgi:N-acetylmuramoyl-L-alanine amidase
LALRLFALVFIVTASLFAQTGAAYRVVTTAGVQTLPVQAANGTVDMVTLDAVARLFGLTVRDDARAGGAVIASGSDRIIITPGQSSVAVNGRVVSLPAAISRSGSTWLVPVDLIRNLRRGADIRRESRLIVIPPAVVPTVTPRLERTSTGARLTLSLAPAAPSRITRDGTQVTVRLQAPALDLVALSAGSPDFVRDIRVAESSLVVDLGPLVANVRNDAATTGDTIVIELVAPAGSVAPPPAAPPPSFDRPEPGLRTVVIDPGHGGDDAGVRGADGIIEKDVTLAVATRLKNVLESRYGLRVLLTREGDANVDLDRRASVANNNKADLFISLHANASPLAAVRGAQVLSLDPEMYATVDGTPNLTPAAGASVPLVGGGTRLIDIVPWHLAQLPRAPESLTLAGIVTRRLVDAGVGLLPTPSVRGPWRGLVGANMPAVLIELGMLSNEDDARQLREDSYRTLLAEAVGLAIGDVRGGIPRPSGGQQ